MNNTMQKRFMATSRLSAPEWQGFHAICMTPTVQLVQSHEKEEEYVLYMSFIFMVNVFRSSLTNSHY